MRDTAAKRDELAMRLRGGSRRLPPSVLQVAKFIDENRITALASSASQLAERIGTSDASVIRAVKALGFEGLPHLRNALAVALEQRATPADNMRRTLKDVGESAEKAIADVVDAHAAALAELATRAGRANIAEAIRTLLPGRRIAIFGIGPSAHVARYLAAILHRTGRESIALDATGLALADQLLALRQGDALVALSYGVPYREVLATLRECRRLTLPVVLVTDAADTPLSRFADVVLTARRGRRQRVAVHAATLAALEAVALGLAASDRQRALDTLERLNDLRSAVSGTRRDIP